MKRHECKAVEAGGNGVKRLAVGTMLTSVILGLAATGAFAESEGVTAPGGFAALERVELEEMAAARGREGSVIHFKSAQSVQNMQAIVSDTQISVVNGDMVSGNIRFDANALGHYSGTGIFSAVTGNGNAINNAVGISVFISAE